MPKVRSLKTKADYRSPTTKGKYQATDLQIDWEGPVLHHKEGIFPKKLAFKDVGPITPIEQPSQSAGPTAPAEQPSRGTVPAEKPSQ